MPSRLVLATALGVLASLAVTSVGRADLGTSAESDSDSGTVAAGASMAVTGGQQASSAPASRPVCRYERWVRPPEAQAIIDAGGSGGEIETMEAAAAAADAGLFKRICPTATGGENTTWALVPNRVSIEELIASASQRVSAQVPSPSTNMSPDPSVGGIVNIGLWLAGDDPGQVSITASVGPVWATVTARYTSTSWAFGNGDSLVCEGLGTPIVNLDTADQGPCGYTYEWPSAPKFTGTDDLAYHVSVTGHWVVTFETSSGSSGSLSPIDRTVEFSYQVREIQTVRTAGNG